MGTGKPPQRRRAEALLGYPGLSWPIARPPLRSVDDGVLDRGGDIARMTVHVVVRRESSIAIAAFVEMTYGGEKEFRLHTDIPARILGTEASSIPERPLAPDRPLAGTTP
jgi:hypothetical protein